MPMPQVMQKRALEHPKITVMWDSVIDEAYGNERVRSRRHWEQAGVAAIGGAPAPCLPAVALLLAQFTYARFYAPPPSDRACSAAPR